MSMEMVSGTMIAVAIMAMVLMLIAWQRSE